MIVLLLFPMPVTFLFSIFCAVSSLIHLIIALELNRVRPFGPNHSDVRLTFLAIILSCFPNTFRDSLWTSPKVRCAQNPLNNRSDLPWKLVRSTNPLEIPNGQRLLSLILFRWEAVDR
jgi:hypothetical protein